jgi:hypothetical protein
VEDDACADPEVMLGVVKEACRVVIELDDTDVNTLPHSYVKASSKCPGKSCVRLVQYIPARPRTDRTPFRDSANKWLVNFNAGARGPDEQVVREAYTLCKQAMSQIPATSSALRAIGGKGATGGDK